MSNIHFQQKTASDELWDTLFFATGEYPVKQKLPEFRTLEVPGFKLKIKSFRSILVNDKKCTSVSEAKFVIQQQIL
jgi:hypothetical protein